MRGARSQAGYTLLEVVVAFAILVLSLGALFESFSMTLHRSEKARNLSRAGLVAASLRDRLGADLPPRPPVSEGQEDDCDWRVQSQPAARAGLDHPPALAMLQVVIEVHCGEAGTLGTARLETMELVRSE